MTSNTSTEWVLESQNPALAGWVLRFRPSGSQIIKKHLFTTHKSFRRGMLCSWETVHMCGWLGLNSCFPCDTPRATEYYTVPPTSLNRADNASHRSGIWVSDTDRINGVPLKKNNIQGYYNVVYVWSSKVNSPGDNQPGGLDTPFPTDFFPDCPCPCHQLISFPFIFKNTAYYMILLADEKID